MKKTLSFLSNLFLSSTLFWGVPTAGAEEIVVKDAVDTSTYCHIKFPEMRAESLDWKQPVLDETSGNVVDFYGPCDYNPTGVDAINAQRRLMHREIFGDGD